MFGVSAFSHRDPRGAAYGKREDKVWKYFWWWKVIVWAGTWGRILGIRAGQHVRVGSRLVYWGTKWISTQIANILAIPEGHEGNLRTESNRFHFSLLFHLFMSLKQRRGFFRFHYFCRLQTFTAYLLNSLCGIQFSFQSRSSKDKCEGRVTSTLAVIGCRRPKKKMELKHKERTGSDACGVLGKRWTIYHSKYTRYIWSSHVSIPHILHMSTRGHHLHSWQLNTTDSK